MASRERVALKRSSDPAASRAFRAERESYFTGHLLDIVPAFIVFFRGFQVFQHQRSVNRQPRETAQVGSVINLAAAGSNFAKRDLDVILPVQILGVTGNHPTSQLLEAFGNRQHVDARLAPAAGLALSCAVLWAIFMRVRSASETTASTIAEAFIGYLILATAFAQLYWILNQVMAKPFNQFIPSFEISTFLYFSLVTLTSVGYGGIAPVNPYVRMVAAFEGVTGIFYIAVVVARLVSSYRSAERSRE